jgi:hypothetical protein
MQPFLAGRLLSGALVLLADRIDRMQRNRVVGAAALLAVIHGGLVAQTPRLAGIDVFGTRAFDADYVRSHFGVELERLSAALSRGEFSDSVAELYKNAILGLRARGGFAHLDFSFINYYDGTPRTFLTVDVVERSDSARRMAFNAVPRGSVEDPAGLVAAYRKYFDQGMKLLQTGAIPSTDPPCAVLHCAPGSDHPSLRAETERFTREVPKYRQQILRVLRSDRDPQNRAAAAFLLGHLQDAQWVANALSPATTDPNATVRNNALRVLIMLAHRTPPVSIPLAPILRALQFPATSDRNKAGYVLAALADRPENREPIRRQVGPVLLEMLQLEQPNNHDPAFEVLRKISGRDFAERDYAAWRDWLNSPAR